MIHFLPKFHRNGIHSKIYHPYLSQKVLLKNIFKQKNARIDKKSKRKTEAGRFTN